MSSETADADNGAPEVRPDRYRIPTADELRELRHTAGLTLEEAGYAVGVSDETVRGWEQGKNPSVGNLRALLEAYRHPDKIEVPDEDDEEEDDEFVLPPDEELPDIIPREFLEEWETDEVEEALKKAENAAPTTPRSAMDRCGSCLSVRIRHKPGYEDQHTIGRPRVCTNCRTHFEEPAPGKETWERVVDTVILLSEPETCRACSEDALFYVFDDDTAPGMYVCGEHLADAVAREVNE